MNKFKLKCQLLKLRCFVTAESEADEIYLKCDNKKLWPTQKKFESISSHQERSINLEILNIDSGKELIIELWEYDFLKKDDLLGRFTLVIDKKGGPHSTDLQFPRQKGKYQLDWNVLADAQIASPSKIVNSVTT